MEAKSRSKWAAGIVVAGVIAGSVAAITLRERATASEVALLRSEVSELRTLAAKQASAKRVAPVAMASAAALATASAAMEQALQPEQPEQAVPVDPEVAAHEREARNAEVINGAAALYASTHAAEPSDPEWSGTATRTVLATYAGERFRSLSVTADCRSTICRLDFSFPDNEEGMGQVRDLTSTAPWPGKRLTHFDLETLRGSSYIAREDFDLPPLSSIN